MKKLRCSKLAMLFLPTLLLIGCASTVPSIESAEVEALDEKEGQVSHARISEFILGVGDSIDITVYRNDDLKKSVKIDPSGKIMYPLIGDVQAAGKDIFALRDEIRERLSKYVVDPQVTISVTSVQSQKVMVLGEVNSPGIFTLDSDIGVIEAISKAGGMTHDAKLSNVLLIRRKKDKPEIISLDLKKTFKKGNVSQNMMLQSGDIIYLPAVAIADVSWYFTHLSKILSPIVNLESGIVLWPQASDVLRGEEGVTQTIVAP